MPRTWALIWGLALFLGACGGRVAQPVETVRAVDTRLSCDHLQGEFNNNLKRLQELTQERRSAEANNVGWLLGGPLFMDLSDTERQEATAILSRNERLTYLMKQKKC